MTQANLAKEFVQFLGKNKKIWAIPIMVILLLIIIVVVLSQSQAIAPFLY